MNSAQPKPSGVSPISLDVAKDLHNVPFSDTEARERAYSNPRPPPRQEQRFVSTLFPVRRQQSLMAWQKPTSGYDGRGAPMFSNLAAAKNKHMYDGYEDMRPPFGLFNATYRKLVNAKHGASFAESNYFA